MKTNIKKKVTKRDVQDKKRKKMNIIQNGKSQEFGQQQINISQQGNDNQVSMLVSNSETQNFKLQYLISSYKQLIQQCKLERKQFLQTIKMQLQRHHHYFNQILEFVKFTQQNTKKSLKQLLENYSNVYTVKISLLTSKLHVLSKVAFSHYQPLNTNKIMKPNAGCLLSKATSYEAGVNFDLQLKEIYTLKQSQSTPDFIDQQTILQSIQNIKKTLIKNWEYQSQKSVSFSSISNPEQSEKKFDQDFLNQKDFFTMRYKSQDGLTQKDRENGSLKKIYFCSNETDTTFKSKPNISVTRFKLKQEI